MVQFKLPKQCRLINISGGKRGGGHCPFNRLLLFYVLSTAVFLAKKDFNHSPQLRRNLIIKWDLKDK